MNNLIDCFFNKNLNHFSSIYKDRHVVHSCAFDVWPTYSNAMIVDESQYEAIKHSFSHRVTLIQGPPCTGKTHVGAIILNLLLKNRQNSNKPILMLCFKNQALYEFIDMCSQNCKFVMGELYRLGHSSKNNKVDRFKLNINDDKRVNDKN